MRFINIIIALSIFLFSNDLERYHQIQINNYENDILETLKNIGIEFDHFIFENNVLELAVSDSDIEILDDKKKKYTIDEFLDILEKLIIKNT